jgi:hypothetical protein
MAKLITKQVFDSLVKATTKQILPKITAISNNQKVTSKQSDIKNLVNDCLVNKGRFNV